MTNKDVLMGGHLGAVRLFLSISIKGVGWSF
jgi:hypothetical protein